MNKYRKRNERRRFLMGTAVLSCTPLLPLGTNVKTVFAQEEEFTLEPGTLRQLHSSAMFNAPDYIVGDSVFGPEDIRAILYRLVEEGLLTEDEAERLHKIVETLLSQFEDNNEFEDALEQISSTLDEIIDSLSQLGRGIVEIIQSSMDVAQEILSVEEFRFMQRAMAHDIRGALDGAYAGATLGARIPRVGSGLGAVFGLFGGSVSTSVIGFFER